MRPDSRRAENATAALAEDLRHGLFRRDIPLSLAVGVGRVDQCRILTGFCRFQESVSVRISAHCAADARLAAPLSGSDHVDINRAVAG